MRLAAAPVDGQANEGLVRFLAALFDVPRSAVQITHGAAAREKRLLIQGLDAEAVLRRLGPPTD